MNQKRFLLEWLQIREGQRMTHEEILERAASDYLRLLKKRFGDPGKTARQLFALGRIQRKNRFYWYDSKLDSRKSLQSEPTASAKTSLWKKFLVPSHSFDRENWLELLSRIDSELSKSDQVKVRDALARALSKTSMNP
jgi:hypothetical protein